MTIYECGDCGMSVQGLSCCKCGSSLQHTTIKDAHGKAVHVSECPKKCGKIKSPMCCGHDMKVAKK